MLTHTPPPHHNLRKFQKFCPPRIDSFISRPLRPDLVKNWTYLFSLRFGDQTLLYFAHFIQLTKRAFCFTIYKDTTKITDTFSTHNSYVYQCVITQSDNFSSNKYGCFDFWRNLKPQSGCLVVNHMLKKIIKFQKFNSKLIKFL